MSDDSVTCWVYRTPQHPETYLYLSEEGAFEQVPDALRDQFGDPALVMRLELHAARKLAREDVQQVMNNLRTQGFHLQLSSEFKPRYYRTGDT
jgi:uncharacterized protein YcgL (UPF0745 family)